MKTLMIFAIPLRTLLLILLSSLEPLSAQPDDNWQLVWSDEFNENGLPNAQWWDFEEGYLRNNELQYYTKERTENCRQENGNLIIEARSDNFEGHSITSASLTSRRSASWTYGRFEIRAQLASGKGTWPAIWMLGDNISEVGWPHCGEIDIMEFVGYDPDTIHGTVHTTAYNHIQNTEVGGSIDFGDLTTAMHTYVVEWEPDEMRFYVDGQLYFTFENDGTQNDATWPFHRPQHLKLNLAIGGGWGGAQGVDSSIYPATFLIDYVRVYQRPETAPYSIQLESSGPGILRIEPEKDTYQPGETVTLIADPNVGMRLGKWKNVQVDRALRTSYEVNRSQTITADFTDPASLLLNSGFSSGLTAWYNHIDSSAAADISTNEEGHATITVTRAGSADWHVQFGQGGFGLETGKRYELSFEAKTNSGSPKLIAALAQAAEPYSTYQSSTIALADSLQLYTIEFTHSQLSDANTRVEFRLGSQLGAVSLDNIRLRNLDESPLTGYESWKQSQGIRPIADDEDPDQDFRPNLAEYLWGSDPNSTDPYKTLATVSSASGQVELRANFDEDALPSDISIVVEQSNDFKDWAIAPPQDRSFQRLKLTATPAIDD